MIKLTDKQIISSLYTDDFDYESLEFQTQSEFETYLVENLCKLIINTTPHELDIRLGNGEFVKIPKSDKSIRCQEKKKMRKTIAGINVRLVEYGDIEGLPSFENEEDFNHIYVVSLVVLNKLNEMYLRNPDALPYKLFFAPGEAVRDENGKIVGADGLSVHNIVSLQFN